MTNDGSEVALLDNWTIRPFDPEVDLAPETYADLDPALAEASCDGTTEGIHPDEGLRAATAASRGWGSGWPNCQYSKWVTITRSDGQRLSLHREISELAALLLDETERLGYDLIVGWNWGSSCRAIRGSSSPSNHSWGLALDLNAPENPMGPRTGAIRRHPHVIALWKRYGFRWGGDYSGRADDMHFEFLGTPDDAKRFTELARKKLATEEDWLEMASQAEVEQALENVIGKRLDKLLAGLFAKNPADVKEATGRNASHTSLLAEVRNNTRPEGESPVEP